MIRDKIIIAIILVFASFALLAQESNNKKEKNFRITPYVFPVYSPETDFQLSIGALTSFKISKKDTVKKRSIAPFSGEYSLNHSKTFSFRPYLFINNDLYRLSFALLYKEMPYHYWGVGYKNATNKQKSQETTQYNRNWFSFEGILSHKLASNIYAGLSFSFNSSEASNLNTIMQEDENVLKEGTHINSNGLGLALEADHTDFIQNAHEGYYLGINLTQYSKFIGSNYNFSKFTLDYRFYHPIAQRKTLAYILKTVTSSQNTPWTELPQLGSQFDLRGYYWGRFRDKNICYSIVEYRHMFQRKTLNKKNNHNSIWGFVTWAGTGSVAPNYSEMTDWIANFGIGLRAELQPKANLRIDYGIGKNSNGLYVTFSEAF